MADDRADVVAGLQQVEMVLVDIDQGDVCTDLARQDIGH